MSLHKSGHVWKATKPTKKEWQSRGTKQFFLVLEVQNVTKMGENWAKNGLAKASFASKMLALVTEKETCPIQSIRPRLFFSFRLLLKFLCQTMHTTVRSSPRAWYPHNTQLWLHPPPSPAVPKGAGRQALVWGGQHLLVMAKKSSKMGPSGLLVWAVEVPWAQARMCPTPPPLDGWIVVPGSACPPGGGVGLALRFSLPPWWASVPCRQRKFCPLFE